MSSSCGMKPWECCRAPWTCRQGRSTSLRASASATRHWRMTKRTCFWMLHFSSWGGAPPLQCTLGQGMAEQALLFVSDVTVAAAFAKPCWHNFL